MAIPEPAIELNIEDFPTFGFPISEILSGLVVYGGLCSEKFL